MRDHPFGPDLLSIARDTLRNDVLPAVPADKRYTVLMIAAAMAIAERELRDLDAPIRAAYHRLCDLYGEAAVRIEDHFGLLREYRRRSRQLAADLRAGRMPPAGEAAVREHLKDTTIARLREANPKYLATWGLD